MKSITTYQGQKVRVQLVDECSISVHGRGGREADGNESVWRDQAGQYYRQVETYKGTDRLLLARRSPKKYQYHNEVTPIGLSEALLWVLSDTGYPGFPRLRRDVEALLSDGAEAQPDRRIVPLPLAPDPRRTNYALNAAKPTK